MLYVHTHIYIYIYTYTNVGICIMYSCLPAKIANRTCFAQYSTGASAGPQISRLLQMVF